MALTTAETYTPELISVVLCTYNGEKYLDEQLWSIRNQSWKNLEILIGDDASSDGTLAIATNHAQQDSRIRIYSNATNLGYNENFSQTCSKAQGQFIAFADQDDYWESEKIEKLTKNFRKECPLIYCDSAPFSGPIAKIGNKKSLTRRFEGVDIFKLALFNTINGHAILARTDFIISLLPFPKHLFYDWYIGAVAATKGGVQYYPERLVHQRMHGQNASVIGSPGEKIDTKTRHLQSVLMHCQLFKQLEGVSPSSKAQLEQWVKHLQQLTIHRKWLGCFLFMLKNRNSLFWYKKRKISFFSHLKHTSKLLYTYLKYN